MHPKTGRRKDPNRVFAWALVLALIPLAAAAVILYRSYQRAASEIIIERDLQVAYLSAARLREELLGFADVLSAVARTPRIYGKNAADQREALQAAANRFAVFDAGVVLLDNFGKVRATVPERPPMLREDWSDRPFFRQLLASSRFAFSDGMQDPASNTTTVAVAVPVQGEEGEFVGALAGMFNLGTSRASSLYASIVRLRLGQSGTTYLVDGSGRILYDSDFTQIGVNFDASGLFSGGLPKVGRAERSRDAAGNDVVAAYAPVPGTGWTLVTEDDWETVTAGIRPYSNALLGVLIIGVVLPLVGSALLLRRQGRDTADQEQMYQATQMSHLVHRTLIPAHVPMLPGWRVTVHYQPAGAGGGDFYDYLILSDGRLMLMVGNVGENTLTGALLTATTRAGLRAAAHQALSPSLAVARCNELLCPEVEAGKSVAAVYSLLHPDEGRLQVASAGHPLPIHSGNGHVGALGSSGHALGLAPGAQYEQAELTVHPGECVLFLSNGLVGARNAGGEAFGEERLAAAMEKVTGRGQALVDALLSELRQFVGSEWAQEHDITLVVLERNSESLPT